MSRPTEPCSQAEARDDDGAALSGSPPLTHRLSESARWETPGEEGAAAEARSGGIIEATGDGKQREEESVVSDLMDAPEVVSVSEAAEKSINGENGENGEQAATSETVGAECDRDVSGTAETQSLHSDSELAFKKMSLDPNAAEFTPSFAPSPSAVAATPYLPDYTPLSSTAAADVSAVTAGAAASSASFVAPLPAHVGFRAPYMGYEMGESLVPPPPPTPPTPLATADDRESRAIMLSLLPPPEQLPDAVLAQEIERTWGPLRFLDLSRRWDGVATAHFYDLRHAKAALRDVQQQHWLQQQRTHHRILLRLRQIHTREPPEKIIQDPYRPLPNEPVPLKGLGLVAGWVVWAQAVDPDGEGGAWAGEGKGAGLGRGFGGGGADGGGGEGRFGAVQRRHQQQKSQGPQQHHQQQQQQQQLRQQLQRRQGGLWQGANEQQGGAWDGGNGCVVVRNVEPSVSMDSLRALFATCGDVKEVRAVLSKKLHRLVEFFDIRAAAHAVQKLTGTELAGRRIKIEFARQGVMTDAVGTAGGSRAVGAVGSRGVDAWQGRGRTEWSSRGKGRSPAFGALTHSGSDTRGSSRSGGGRGDSMSGSIGGSRGGSSSSSQASLNTPSCGSDPPSHTSTASSSSSHSPVHTPTQPSPDSPRITDIPGSHRHDSAAPQHESQPPEGAIPATESSFTAAARAASECGGSPEAPRCDSPDLSSPGVESRGGRGEMGADGLLPSGSTPGPDGTRGESARETDGVAPVEEQVTGDCAKVLKEGENVLREGEKVLKEAEKVLKEMLGGRAVEVSDEASGGCFEAELAAGADVEGGEEEGKGVEEERKAAENAVVKEGCSAGQREGENGGESGGESARSRGGGHSDESASLTQEELAPLSSPGEECTSGDGNPDNTTPATSAPIATASAPITTAPDTSAPITSAPITTAPITTALNTSTPMSSATASAQSSPDTWSHLSLAAISAGGASPAVSFPTSLSSSPRFPATPTASASHASAAAAAAAPAFANPAGPPTPTASTGFAMYGHATPTPMGVGFPPIGIVGAAAGMFPSARPGQMMMHWNMPMAQGRGGTGGGGGRGEHGGMGGMWMGGGAGRGEAMGGMQGRAGWRIGVPQEWFAFVEEAAAAAARSEAAQLAATSAAGRWHQYGRTRGTRLTAAAAEEGDSSGVEKVGRRAEAPRPLACLTDLVQTGLTGLTGLTDSTGLTASRDYGGVVGGSGRVVVPHVSVTRAECSGVAMGKGEKAIGEEEDTTEKEEEVKGGGANDAGEEGAQVGVQVGSQVGEGAARGRRDGTRTTVMVRNIPNRYNQAMLLALLDAHCLHCNSQPACRPWGGGHAVGGGGARGRSGARVDGCGAGGDDGGDGGESAAAAAGCTDGDGSNGSDAGSDSGSSGGSGGSGEEEEQWEPLSAYDFVYLPIDFKNRCNLGYAFVNLTTVTAALRLFRAFHLQPWEAFNSRKVCRISYARVQGCAALEEHFRNSRFACDTEEFLPLVFSPPRNGISCPPPVLAAGHMAGQQVTLTSGNHHLALTSDPRSPRRDVLNPGLLPGMGLMRSTAPSSVVSSRDQE
ncbi:unnamed protein product [Closterium sp. NIES-64]|nr:unnamed protein product [Closterium sp. NIES-64]